MNLPRLLFADKYGKIYRHPHLRMALSSSNLFEKAQQSDLIRLPAGSTLFYLPGRAPVGYDCDSDEFIPLFKFEGKLVFAVGAFIVPAYLRLHNPATVKFDSVKLPLWAYTACGEYAKDIYVSAMRIDRRVRQSPRFYSIGLIKKQVRKFLKKYPVNRLYKHLANCALNYNCLAAKNLFMERWEAPLPTSRFCNANCIGCLSYQESDCAASHSRINFEPSVSEISEVICNHLVRADEAIVSFGQGCEGEPLLCADSIGKAITRVRSKLSRGTINMNTNASIPEKIKLLCERGMDSFRVSLNSTQEKVYNLYFRPRNYKFDSVLKSIAIAKKYNKFVAINLFIFPGFSDSEEQIKSLVNFIKNTGVDMLQLRNLNIDPDFYFEALKRKSFSPKGVKFLVNVLNREFPRLKLGYFNLPKEHFKTFKNMVI